jgi:hypothetical protein
VARPTQEALDDLLDAGYRVTDRTDRVITLERQNLWRVHIFGALVGGLLGGGLNRSPRTERLYLHVDERGQAEVRYVAE